VAVKNKIKPFLERRGITAYKFRQDVGIAQRTAYDLYNNPAQLPSSTVLSKICDTYEVQPCEILVWVPKNQKNLEESASTSNEKVAPVELQSSLNE
jgi:DNA-binding Xre family transcriptional regulator